MSAQFSPASAFTLTKQMVKSMPIENILPDIVDNPSKMFWEAAPWRWTLGALTAVVVPSNADDVSLGTLPDDFFFAYQAWLVSDSDAGVPTYLEVVGALPADISVRGPALRIAIEGEAGATGTARFYPAPGTLSANTKLYVLYKKKAPVLTKQNMDKTDVLLFPDDYYFVYCAGMLYYGYLFADDNRAGAATLSEGRIAYSGQLGVFQALIEGVRQREKLPIEDDRMPVQKGTK